MQKVLEIIFILTSTFSFTKTIIVGFILGAAFQYLFEKIKLKFKNRNKVSSHRKFWNE